MSPVLRVETRRPQTDLLGKMCKPLSPILPYIFTGISSRLTIIYVLVLEQQAFGQTV
jgi:hypothetical protein